MAHCRDIHNGADIPTTQTGGEMMDTCSTAEESVTIVATTDEVENNTSMWGEGVDPMFVMIMAICPPVHMRNLE